MCSNSALGSVVGQPNPFVEPEMITTALALHRRDHPIERHLAFVVWLADHMSQSAGMIPVSDDLRRSVGQDEGPLPGLVGRYSEVDPNEIYRRKLLLSVRALEASSGNQAPPFRLFWCVRVPRRLVYDPIACCRMAGRASPKGASGT